jgi:hypothetical protein
VSQHAAAHILRRLVRWLLLRMLLLRMLLLRMLLLRMLLLRMLLVDRWLLRLLLLLHLVNHTCICKHLGKLVEINLTVTVGIQPF